MMLKEAKQQCDYLICCLQVDPSIDRPEKNKPVQTIVERHTQLSAVKYVDEIIPYSTERDLEDILSMQDIDVRILGEEYQHKDFTGKQICKQRGIELYFNKRQHRFSTTLLRNEIASAESVNNLTKEQLIKMTTIDDYSPYTNEHGKIYSDYLTDLNDGYSPN